MRPGSGLEQLSHFAERLKNGGKCQINRHKSFAAIPSRPELETHHGILFFRSLNNKQFFNFDSFF